MTALGPTTVPVFKEVEGDQSKARPPSRCSRSTGTAGAPSSLSLRCGSVRILGVSLKIACHCKRFPLRHFKTEREA